MGLSLHCLHAFPIVVSVKVKCILHQKCAGGGWGGGLNYDALAVMGVQPLYEELDFILYSCIDCRSETVRDVSYFMHCHRYRT